MFSYVCSLYLSFCAVLSHVWLFATTWTVAPKAPLVRGIFQSKILEWVTISFLQGSSQPKDWTPVFYISFLADGFFTTESPLASNFSLKSRPSWTIKNISGCCLCPLRTKLPTVEKSLYTTVIQQPQMCESESCSVVSNSLWPHGLYSPWNSPGQNTGVGSHFLRQGIFPTQGSKPDLPHCRWILYQLSHQGVIIINSLPVPAPHQTANP